MWCKQTASSSTASWVHLKIVTAALWVSTAALRFSQGCRQLAKMEHRDIHLAARARNDGQNCPARRPARARAAPLWTPKSSGGGGACRGNGGDGRRVRGRAVGLCVCSCACVRARMRACAGTRFDLVAPRRPLDRRFSGSGWVRGDAGATGGAPAGSRAAGCPAGGPAG